jgi:glycosyltransferase involved in cell wall biosynthesis
MNLLLINYEYPPIGGGAATATYHTAHELAKQGHQVIVLSANYQKLSGWMEEEGIKIYRCWALRKFKDHSTLLEQLSFVISATFVLPKLLKKQAIDGMIIYFSLPCGPLGLWGKILNGIPYIISSHGGDIPNMESSVKWLHWILTPVRRMVLKYAQSIVAVSEGLKKAAEKADPFQVVVIPNGVDTDFFYPINYQNETFNFLFVGRFHPQKNLFFLLEQLHQLNKMSKAPFKCHLVGDGPLRESLYKYSIKLESRNYNHLAWMA